MAIFFFLVLVPFQEDVLAISILQPLSDRVAPPKFKTPPTWPTSPYYDEFGPPISVSCDLTSRDQATLVWYKDGIQLKQTSSLVLHNNNQTLTFKLPVQNQTGTYECLAYNKAGNISHSGYIFITARKQDSRPRVVLTDPGSLVKHATVGDNVTISCTFDVGGSTTGLFDRLTNWNGTFVTRHAKRDLIQSPMIPILTKLSDSTQANQILYVKNEHTFNMDWNRDEHQVNDTDHTTWGINQTQTNDQILSLTITSFKATDYGSYECVGINHHGNDSRIVSIVPPEHNKGKLPMVIIIVTSCSSLIVLVVLSVTGRLYVRYKRNRKYEVLEWMEPDVEQYDVPKRKIKFDVFVSYSHEDLLWVKDELFKQMTDLKYEVCLDFKDFVPGMAISENIIDAIYSSRKTIIVMSRHFLKSTWGQFELQQAHYRAISQRKDALILIKLDKCKVPTKLMGKTFLDWTDDKVLPHFWDRLFESLGEPAGYSPDDRLITDITEEPITPETRDHDDVQLITDILQEHTTNNEC